MKTFKNIAFLVLVMLFIQTAQAQNEDYKGHCINAQGKVTDKDGKHMGNVTPEGVITDASDGK